MYLQKWGACLEALRGRDSVKWGVFGTEEEDEWHLYD